MTRARLWPAAMCAALAMICVGADRAFGAQISLMNWNMGNLPNTAAQGSDLARIFQHVGTLTSGGNGFDLLAMMETDTASATETAALAQTVYGRPGYTSILSTADGGSDRTGFIYDSAKLSLLGSSEPFGTDLTHRIVRGHFQPIGGGANSDFYVYSVHLKSGEASTDRALRLSEAQSIRADADALGDGANVLFVGDFNWSSADERGPHPTLSAFDAFAAGGNAQAFDPVNAVGDWRDNLAYLALHTNDPGAAMDDRFDMQLASGELFDGVGLEYVSGSYRVVGNNGTHTLNGDIRTGTGAPEDVLAALYGFSDHLPVLAAYSFEVPEPGSMTVIVMAAWTSLSRRRPR